MGVLAQIVEMDQERDRKTCINLDLKVNGANRELAQWVADHRGRYSAEEIARWLGCGAQRIKMLRQWAERGFEGAPTNDEKRKERDRRPIGDVMTSMDLLETNDNSESGDDIDPETGEVIESEIADPEVIDRALNKLIKVFAFDREAVARINTAIDRMLGKWRSVQSTLEKKG